eukprot:11378444-Prorocentrum_lima.AAC.1
MTSSLVGSEMCIRDSFYAAALTWVFPIVFVIVPCTFVIGLTWFSWHRQSVSYTHLTLPTICSV